MNDVERKSLLYLNLIFIYYLVNMFVSRKISGINIILVKALFIILAIVYFLRKEKTRPQTSLKEMPFLKLMVIIAALLYVLSYIFLGLVDGFGRNPLDTSARGMLINIITFLPYLVIIELLRDRIINKVRKKKLFAGIIIIVFTLTSIDIMNYTSILSNSFKGNIEFLFSEFLPKLIINFSLTQISLMGGFWATIWFKMSMDMPVYLLPILPNLRWVTKSMLNLLFPIFTYLILKSAMSERDGRDRIHRKDKENPVQWVLTYVISIFIVWFAVGILPVFPTVILTGSMEPKIYPGDVTIVQKVDKKEDLKIGDIIQYNAGDFFIIHRIVSIEEGKYKTKGDNNNAPDIKLVSFEQVKGKVLFKVAKLGKPVLLLRSSSGNSLDKVRKQYDLGGN